MAGKKTFNLVDDLKFNGGVIKIKGTGTPGVPPIETKERAKAIFANEGLAYLQFLGSFPVILGNVDPEDPELRMMLQMMGSIPQVYAVKIEEKESGRYVVTPDTTNMGFTVMARNHPWEVWVPEESLEDHDICQFSNQENYPIQLEVSQNTITIYAYVKYVNADRKRKKLIDKGIKQWAGTYEYVFGHKTKVKVKIKEVKEDNTTQKCTIFKCMSESDCQAIEQDIDEIETDKDGTPKMSHMTSGPLDYDYSNNRTIVLYPIHAITRLEYAGNKKVLKPEEESQKSSIQDIDIAKLIQEIDRSSYIDVREMSDDEYTNIVTHEFGHSLGLVDASYGGPWNWNSNDYDFNHEFLKEVVIKDGKVIDVIKETTIVDGEKVNEEYIKIDGEKILVKRSEKRKVMNSYEIMLTYDYRDVDVCTISCIDIQMILLAAKEEKMQWYGNCKQFKKSLGADRTEIFIKCEK